MHWGRRASMSASEERQPWRQQRESARAERGSAARKTLVQVPSTLHRRRLTPLRAVLQALPAVVVGVLRALPAVVVGTLLWRPYPPLALYPRPLLMTGQLLARRQGRNRTAHPQQLVERWVVAAQSRGAGGLKRGTRARYIARCLSVPLRLTLRISERPCAYFSTVSRLFGFATGTRQCSLRAPQ